jgi:5-formyltetrahydrofolate cyclo-ligase
MRASIAPETPLDRIQLRRFLKARRRGLSLKDRHAAARQVARIALRNGLIQQGRRIGLYLPLPDEVDTGPLLKIAVHRGCTVAVPCIVSSRQGRMRFVDLHGPLRPGPFGILEPRSHQWRSAFAMDIVFMPLVGFDNSGNRIGMGRGFYDRHFEFRHRRQHWHRPLLIGIAFEVQRIDALPVAAHDVPLDAVVTESTLQWFGPRQGK